QVGQTGRTVRPHLYVAAGISGKIQHLVGMKDSEFIVSINTDPDAEIVKYSDFYIHGNLYDALPKLTEEIRKRKSGSKNKV
ncbi:MAG: electron transfer flavoprotein subunit alpha/FixB family protein, partial [Thermoplasmataceae archaeon]